MKRDDSSSGLGALIVRIERMIRAIPRGKSIDLRGRGESRGIAGRARMVARILRRGFGLPWQRVLGAGGEIKLRGDSAAEQRLRLQAEGVRFRGPSRRHEDLRVETWAIETAEISSIERRSRRKK